MDLLPHPDFRIQKLTIGREQAPLIVIDNLVANPDELVDIAASKTFVRDVTYYPGVRSKATLSYQRFVLEKLRDVFADHFGLRAAAVRFTHCHFSLVTMPPENLAYLQQIPHIDSTSGEELAFIHYLFKADLGGTAFYRHRSTGYEIIDEARKLMYWRMVDEEKAGPNRAAGGYINGDTPLYEQICRPDGVFNRMLMYRRNSLHTVSLGPHFIPDPNPRTGRLSINGFLA
jgi:hypothetical protein